MKPAKRVSEPARRASVPAWRALKLAGWAPVPGGRPLGGTTKTKISLSDDTIGHRPLRKGKIKKEKKEVGKEE